MLTKVQALIVIICVIGLLFFAIMGRRKEPKPGFDKVVIITGIAFAVLVGILLIIGTVFF